MLIGNSPIDISLLKEYNNNYNQLSNQTNYQLLEFTMEMIHQKLSIVGLASFYCETQILMRLQYDKRSAVRLVSRIIPHAKPRGTIL